MERQGAVPLEELLDFKTWLTVHHDRLTSYTPDEVVHLAIASGFSHAVVFQWQVSERFKVI